MIKEIVGKNLKQISIFTYDLKVYVCQYLKCTFALKQNKKFYGYKRVNVDN